MNHHHHHDHQEVAIPADRQGVCIVTGDTFDIEAAKEAGHYAEHNGQTYYFCCATCVRLFNANPDKYLTNSHKDAMLVLSNKEHLVDNVWAFRFTADQPFAWTPGQFIRVELPHDNPDTEGTKRWFTISSTPHDGFVQITTRVTDTTFKQSLASLPIGGELNLVEEPDGDFIWTESDKPLVFVAGGIGITPYYSILKARGHSGRPVNAVLIYNGRDDKLPFKEELDVATRRHPEFKVRYVVGEQLSADKLVEIVPEIQSSQVYLSGPEPMVESLGKQLREAGISDANLHEDFFPNYSQQNY